MKALRESTGLSQSELARLAKCTVQTIYKTEAFLFPNPPVAVVRELAEALNWSEAAVKEFYLERQGIKRRQGLAAILALEGLSLESAVAAVGSKQLFCRLLCIAPPALNRVLGNGGNYEFINKALSSAGASFRF